MAEITRNNAYRTVALIRTPTPHGEIFATGAFLLNKAGEPYLVTAGHAAKKVNAETVIELPNGSGKAPSVFRLSSLTNRAKNPSPIADLCAFPLLGITSSQKGLFTNRFLTFGALKGDLSKGIDREEELTVFGFPSGLGHDSKGSLVPLSFRTYASSDYFFLKDPDYKENLILFALESSSLGGYSGAPVYSLSKERSGIVGFIKGNLNDGQDGHIAIVTPAIFAKYII